MITGTVFEGREMILLNPTTALGSIHTCDLIRVNCLLNNGLYCMHAHSLFDELLHGLKSLIMGCIPILRDCVD